MPTSGIDIPQEIEDAGKLVKSKKLQYLVVELQKKQSKGDREKWVMAGQGEKFPTKEGHDHDYVSKEEFAARYEQFVAEYLKDDKAVFALFDFGRLQIGPKKNINLVGFQWCPDACPVGVKMTYASSIEDMKKKMKSDKLMAVNDLDDVKLDAVLQKFSGVTLDQIE